MAVVKPVASGTSNSVTDSDLTTISQAAESEIYRQTADGIEKVGNSTEGNTQNDTVNNVSSDTITVNIGKNYDNFNTTIADIQNTVEYPQRGHEAFLINKRTHSSVAIRQNGQINLAAGLWSQYKLTPSGKSIEHTLESVEMTNRKKINAEDIVINEHKVNPFLYEITDIKSLETAHNNNILAGNFCIYGSMLVKAWEMNLHRYVLLRRPVRVPMFSPIMNVPEINAGIGVTDPLKIDEQILAKSTKGYQVNKVYADSNSLIGKDGVDREGINRNAQLAISSDGAALGSNGQVITAALDTVDIAEAKVPVITTPVSSANPKADMANRVAQVTGLPPALIWSQWAHETGGFTSALSTQCHNHGGMKLNMFVGTKTVGNLTWTTTGYDSEEHAYFDSEKSFENYCCWYLPRYKEDGLLQAKTIEQYVASLKHGGYMEAGIEEYVKGMLTYYNSMKK